MIRVDSCFVEDHQVVLRRDQVEAQLQDALEKRLAHSQVKDVVMFVYGHNNSFDKAAFRMAQLWHYLGRRGVPVLYTWPARRGVAGPCLATPMTASRASSPSTI